MSSSSATGRIAWLLALALPGCGGREPHDLGPPPRGLVLVVVDTLRADAVLDEAGRVKLLALGALAEEAAVFQLCTSHASLTRPSHASLFSSRMPSEAGVVGNHDILPESVPVLAEWLQERDFHTLALTSFYLEGGHEGLSSEPGLMRGFERIDAPRTPLRWAKESLRGTKPMLRKLRDGKPFFLFFHFVEPHFPYRNHGPALPDVEVRLDEELLERTAADQPDYATRVVTLPPGEHNLTFRGERDFTMLHFDAHGIRRAKLEQRFEKGALMQPSSEFEVLLTNPGSEDIELLLEYCMYDAPELEESRRRYASEVDHMDRLLGELFKALKDYGLYDESLIVFTSDHGEGLGDHGELQHAKNLYEELVRVPLIVRPPTANPGVLAGLRERTGELVGLIDVVPTVLEILHQPKLPGQRGHSLLGSRPGLQFAEGHPPYAKRRQMSVRDERYKMILFPDEDRFLFFDLAEDPKEWTDIFASDSGRRPGWPQLLRSQAATMATSPSLDGMDPALRRDLEALGYLGGDPGDSND